MKASEIINETTTAGGIATVSAPLGAKPISRDPSIYANSVHKPKKKKAKK
jgi:hypothetical protein